MTSFTISAASPPVTSCHLCFGSVHQVPTQLWRVWQRPSGHCDNGNHYTRRCKHRSPPCASLVPVLAGYFEKYPAPGRWFVSSSSFSCCCVLPQSPAGGGRLGAHPQMAHMSRAPRVNISCTYFSKVTHSVPVCVSVTAEVTLGPHLASEISVWLTGTHHRVTSNIMGTQPILFPRAPGCYSRAGGQGRVGQGKGPKPSPHPV